MSARTFTLAETHGMLRRPGVKIRASSDNRGWSSVYASLQRELPFEQAFDAVDDQLIVLHLDPAMVHRRIRKGEDSRLVPTGGMFMMPGGMDFAVRVGGTIRTLHLYLRQSVIGEVARDILDCDLRNIEILPRFGDNDPLIERLLLAVRDTLYDNDPTATPYVDYLARAIAARLVRRHSSISRTDYIDTVRPSMASQRLQKAVDFIEANLDRHIGLPEIANAAGLSPTHFARQFGSTVGQAPHQYVMQRRIEHAERGLVETTTSIAEIAAACGFSNQEHLTRLFRRARGTTPAAYRKSRRS